MQKLIFTLLISTLLLSSFAQQQQLPPPPNGTQQLSSSQQYPTGIKQPPSGTQQLQQNGTQQQFPSGTQQFPSGTQQQFPSGTQQQPTQPTSNQTGTQQPQPSGTQQNQFDLGKLFSQSMQSSGTQDSGLNDQQKQTLNQFTQKFGQDVTNPQVQASNFQNQKEFNNQINNMMQQFSGLGNKTQMQELQKQMQSQFQAQIESKHTEVQNSANSMQENMKNFNGNQQPPQQFQKFQQQLQQFQSQGDSSGMQQMQDRLQTANMQMQNIQNNKQQVQGNFQNFAQQMQNFGQNPPPKDIINGMQQFANPSNQMTGDLFKKFAQQLNNTNPFGQVQNFDQCSQVMDTFAQVSQNQGEVDIMAQVSQNDTDGVTEAQQTMDKVRKQGQGKCAQFVKNGESQFIEGANQFFEGFDPSSIQQEKQFGQEGQPQMTLPPGLMNQAFKGMSNVVAQISQQDPGEWDSCQAISQFALGPLVDIKFFNGNETIPVDGLSSDNAIKFCIPLNESIATDCTDAIGGYVDPTTSDFKTNGVTCNTTASTLPGTNTPCCPCSATHTTTFGLVNSSASASKLLISLFGLIIALLTLLFA